MLASTLTPLRQLRYVTNAAFMEDVRCPSLHIVPHCFGPCWQCEQWTSQCELTLCTLVHSLCILHLKKGTEMEMWGWSQSFCPFLQKNMVQQFSTTLLTGKGWVSNEFILNNQWWSRMLLCRSACEESCGKTLAVQDLSHQLYAAQCVQLMMNGLVVLKTLTHLPRSS